MDRDDAYAELETFIHYSKDLVRLIKEGKPIPIKFFERVIEDAEKALPHLLGENVDKN